MKSAPRTTTLLGGLGLALVGLIQLLPVLLNWIPGAYDTQTMFSGGPAQALQAAALLASYVVLAFGFRTETGIVGSSLLGRIALLLVGLAFPIQILATFGIQSSGVVGTWPAVLVGTVLQLLPFAAVTVAAVTVVRSHILEGFARWSLLFVAAAEVLVFALSTVPNATQSYYFVVFFYLAALAPLLLATTGVSFALHGHTFAVKQQLHSVYTKWRLTT